MTRRASKHRCLRCGLPLLPANGGAWKHIANGHTGRGCAAPYPLTVEKYESAEQELVDGARAALRAYREANHDAG